MIELKQNISEFIKMLEDLREEFGDVQVVGWNTHEMCNVQYVAGVGVTIDG